MKYRLVRLTIVLITLALLTAACGGDNGIGKGLKADGSKGGGGANAIGQATTTTAAVVITTAPATTVRTVTTVPVPPCHTVYINNDSQGASFEAADQPGATQITCTAGRFIHFVNRDNDPEHVSHNLYSDPVNPELTSPPLKYNATWDARVTRKGSYTLKDRDRPYATYVVNVA